MQQCRFHFISGLPRSGSTLLSALLRQNPSVHAGITSPLCAMTAQLIQAMSGEGGGLIEDGRRDSVLRGVFYNYYSAEKGVRIVFDTNRLWTSKLPTLLHLFPNAKVICLVRDVQWIMDSVERALEVNPLLASRLFENEAERATISARVEALSARNRLVGAAWEALRTGCYGRQGASLLLVPYETLTKSPREVLDLIYSFIGEPAFAHDPNHLVFDVPDFDDRLMTPGLHRVKPFVHFDERRISLPPDLVQRLSTLNFWHDTTSLRAHVIGRPG